MASKKGDSTKWSIDIDIWSGCFHLSSFRKCYLHIHSLSNEKKYMQDINSLWKKIATQNLSFCSVKPCHSSFSKQSFSKECRIKFWLLDKNNSEMWKKFSLLMIIAERYDAHCQNVSSISQNRLWLYDNARKKMEGDDQLRIWVRQLLPLLRKGDAKKFYAEVAVRLMVRRFFKKEVGFFTVLGWSVRERRERAKIKER